MRKHTDQVRHNQDFHDCIAGAFKDHFFDWKITVTFYIAVHCLKALANKRNKDIGNTHYDIEKNVSYESKVRVMQIPDRAWDSYNSLQQYSRTARYEGIKDPALFETLRERDYGHAVNNLTYFKRFITGQGIDIGFNG